MTTKKALLSNKSSERYTPNDVASRVWSVMRGIDLDPFSCARANNVIGARMYFNKEMDGIKQKWGISYKSNVGLGEYIIPISMYINPPSKVYIERDDKTVEKSGVKFAWEKLLESRDFGYIRSAIFMAYSIEALQVTLDCKHSMFKFPICMFYKRLRFLNEYLKPLGSNTHSSALIYIPGTENHVDRFVDHFSSMGEIVLPRLIPG
jgi:hypothetical protein